MDIISTLCDELNLKRNQVVNAVKLLDEGNTIAFISRYRKEATGSLDDADMRALSQRLLYLRSLDERRGEIKRLIDEQGKLTDELSSAIDNAKLLQELEDLYRPYKQKKRTRAMIAKEKGLSPLADIILNSKKGDMKDAADEFINPEKEVNTREDAINGACDIIAEMISDNADFRKYIRKCTYETGIINTSAAKDEESVYEMYYDFSQSVKSIADHRVLAINRGEKEGFLSVKISVDEDMIYNYLASQVIKDKESPFYEELFETVKDSYKRLIAPSAEREIRSNLTENSSERAIKLFSKNLHALLMQAPIKGKTVLGVDPGYRTGCKIAVVDSTGKVCDTGVIFCTLKNHDIEKSKITVLNLIKKYDVDIIAIGNGTASKETEIFISDTIKESKKDVSYLIVNEAGASVYSASKEGAEEFPEFSPTQRSAVSIARRTQDPLVEFVKIDPASIGVGQYQHDMNKKQLSEALTGVVEDCVNSVGVDLNTASAALLSYVSGINSSIAKNIVSYRDENGAFKKRSELLKVSKLGPKSYTQCAGFLRIPGADEVLDNTSVHPESYKAAKTLIKTLGYSEDDIKNFNAKDIKLRMKKLNTEVFCEENKIGEITVNDIVDALLKPGRDLRDDFEKPLLLKNVMSIKDLKPGMILTGTVRNVIDFGAFVDIGVHQDGLVHISQISNKYVKHPTDILSVGDVVKVKVTDIDEAKNRISLSMKDVL